MISDLLQYSVTFDVVVGASEMPQLLILSENVVDFFINEAPLCNSLCVLVRVARLEKGNL